MDAASYCSAVHAKRGPPCPSSSRRSRSTAGASCRSAPSRRGQRAAPPWSATLSGRPGGSGSSTSRRDGSPMIGTGRTSSGSSRRSGRRGYGCEAGRPTEGGGYRTVLGTQYILIQVLRTVQRWIGRRDLRRGRSQGSRHTANDDDQGSCRSNCDQRLPRLGGGQCGGRLSR